MWKVFAVVVACASLTVSAKCIRETYEVVGRVTDQGGNSIPGATIDVAWGGSTKWNSGTESTQSKQDGSFGVDVPFDTLSSEGVMGDICKGHLASASVEVAAAGFRPKRNVVQFNGRQAQIIFVLDRLER
ncbi:MAG: hypothetical protein ACXWF6_08630 [Usitatibacter sp.]